jgi:signal transduction histidine kinase
VKKLSTRFALMMAAAAIVPLLAYGAWSLISSRRSNELAVINGNSNAANGAAAQIERYLSDTSRILRSAAAEIHQTGLKPWQKDRMLKDFGQQFHELSEIVLIDGTGQPVASSRVGKPNLPIPSDASRRIGDVLISPFSVDDALLPYAIMAVQLQGSARGWLVARVNLEELWRMVDGIHVAQGQEGFALVVTDEGVLLAHGDPQSKPLVAKRAKMSDHPLLVRMRAASATAPVSSLVYHAWAPPGETAADRTIVGVAAQVPNLGWTVIVEQPTDDAFKIPNALQRTLVIAIALALLAMLLVGYFWGRSFINPILRLTRGTRALAEGRLQERVAVTSKDELGQLGTAFNNMADRLVELQDDLIKKERQATFGRVAVGLVHDLSNPIMNIGNACKMMVMSFDDVEYRQSFKRTVERELAQVKRMLDDLRNIAKPVPLESFPIDVNKALGEVLESMQETAASAGLTLASDLVFGPVYIKGDLFALNRVYRNLITNALQATAAGGRVAVRTKREDDHAFIEVADTGSGIPKERLDTIFDDFVTTKKRGLGLGLAISKKVVEQLGGTISVTSDVGVGTTFTLRFPLTQSRPEQLAS